MATAAISKLFTVGMPVTPGTLGEYVLVVCFAWFIDMKFLVTFPACHLSVSSTVGP